MPFVSGGGSGGSSSSSASTGGAGGTSTVTGINVPVPTFNPSADQLLKFTRISYSEQGSDIGAAAEMSLILNKYYLSGHTDGDANGLYNYLYGNRWWHASANVMDGGSECNHPNPTESEQNNILAVLRGARTLPLYVDEHDYRGDIAYIEGGNGSSINDNSCYVQHQTVIHNNLGSTYTFYCFPTEKSDPFGYTSSANREKFGDGIPAGGTANLTSGISDMAGLLAGGGSLAGKVFDTSPKERQTARVEDGGNPELKTFYRINMTGAQFIKQILAPYCRSQETGQAGYKLWFDDAEFPDGRPGVRLNFKPSQYGHIENKASDAILEGIEERYKFSFGSGQDSSVLEFNPSFTGMVTSLKGANEVEGATIDAVTNDLLATKYSRWTDETRPSTGDSKFDDLCGTFRIGDSSYTADELANRAANLWCNMADVGYTADMTIVGDPQVEPQKMCSVVTYTPQGLPHYSSGVYLIYQVTDEISGGSFQSRLSLMRNAIQIGTDESGGLDITLGHTTNYIGNAAGLLGSGTSVGAGTGASGVASADLNAPLGSGQTVQVPDGLGTYYTVTGYGPKGWHYADGSTRTVASGTNQRTVWDKWVAAGCKYDDHIATLDGRYLVATTPKFGNVGDYITVTLANGQNISCIIGDQKNLSDKGCTEWGHDGGRNVVEFEVDINHYKAVGNVGTSGWKSEWHSNVASITNYGSAI